MIGARSSESGGEMTRTSRFVVAVAATAAVLVLPACGERASVSITVAGRQAQVPSGTTLAEAVTLFRLKPVAGNLLDVEGKVLRHGVSPGSILVNGRRAAGATRLQSGDRVATAPGADRTEPLRREVVAVPGGAPSNPQFVLTRTPGADVIVRGAISHKLVSAHFRPSGRPPTVERAVALTFDDGPWPESTSRILAVLRRLHVRATFFVIGYLVERYPQLVALERRDGMSIGNHTYNHPEVPPFAQLPPELIEDEIALGARRIARLGVHPDLLRPPAGSFSPAVVRAATALGERVVLWSVDSADWIPGATPRQITRRVLAAVRPGSIVLLHDGGGDRSATVKALPGIVKGIRHRGLRLIALAGS
jgi:peptidoglycan/xylan/chitin deacetylase (PgdA/CDA1 family)